MARATKGLLAKGVVMAIFLAGAWLVVDQRSIKPIESPVVVEARGKDRAWHFTYQGEMPRRLMRKLVLPSHTEVELHLRSDDFIYVFSCPSLQQKEIAVPDLEFALRFQTPAPGDHELAMDPMCGFRLPPGQGMGMLTVISKEAYGKWLRERP